MHKPTLSALLPLCIAATIVSTTHGQVPQGAELQGPRQPRPISVEQLTSDVYWIKNIGFAAFIVGDKGVIVLDTGGSPASGLQILDAVSKATSKPVNTVILTHCDTDHVNGLSAFPAGVEIIAQENNKRFLEAAVTSGETGREAVKIPADHMPNHTVGKREEVKIDGITMTLLHWAPAHTSGDLIVYLPEEKLVLAGDVLVMDQHNLPLIHLDKGGTSRGWVETVQQMLTLDADRYVIGHEGVVGKDVLQQQLKASVAERQKVKELYDKGVPLAAIQIAVGDPIANASNQPQRGPRFPAFSEVIYQELKRGTY